MNSTIKNQLEHRTIRKFKEKEINPEIIDILFEVAMRAPSSNALYGFSMIHVKNKEKKALIADVCRQTYLTTTSNLIVFVVDMYRNSKLAKENGVENVGDNVDCFIQGFKDALIAAQNMVIAAESLGIGTVYFGSISNDVQKISDILNLPTLTYPIVAVGLGYEDQNPGLKPRLPKNIQVFEDEYKIFDNYTSNIEEFDLKMNEYIDLRDTSKTVGKFSVQIANKLKNIHSKNKNILEDIRKRGFKI